MRGQTLCQNHYALFDRLFHALRHSKNHRMFIYSYDSRGGKGRFLIANAITKPACNKKKYQRQNCFCVTGRKESNK